MLWFRLLKLTARASHCMTMENNPRNMRRLHGNDDNAGIVVVAADASAPPAGIIDGEVALRRTIFSKEIFF